MTAVMRHGFRRQPRLGLEVRPPLRTRARHRVPRPAARAQGRCAPPTGTDPGLSPNRPSVSGVYPRRHLL